LKGNPSDGCRLDDLRDFNLNFTLKPEQAQPARY